MALEIFLPCNAQGKPKVCSSDWGWEETVLGPTLLQSSKYRLLAGNMGLILPGKRELERGRSPSPRSESRRGAVLHLSHPRSFANGAELD